MNIRYHVTVADPRTHVFEVDLELTREQSGPVRLCLPTWTPGSYLIREYARHLDDVMVEQDGRMRPAAKVDKATWAVGDGQTVHARYTVWAHELTVRTSHLDETHGYINGATVFLYPEGSTSVGGQVSFRLPEGWGVFSALGAVSADTLAFSSIDELFDSPIELGLPRVETVSAGDRLHQLVLCGAGPLDLPALAADLPPLVEAARAVFQRPLPYDRYVFLIHQTGRAGGGLEHRASTSIQVPRFAASKPKSRRRLLGLVAHEYFHLWNVKRIHPDALGPFNYQQEAYTRHLWLMEGGTDYYALLLLGRANLVPAMDLLQDLAIHMHRSEERPGNLHQSLEEASFDAWIKYYRPDAHSPNATVSYYEKGLLAAWLLDVELRRTSNGRRDLDAFLRDLWDRYPQGFPEEAPRAVAVNLGGPALGRFYDDTVASRAHLDWSPLSYLGLRYEVGLEEAGPDTGLTVGGEGPGLDVQSVRAGSPGEAAGVAPGDRVIAVDGFQVDPGQWEERLAWFSPGTAVTLQLFRDRQLLERSLVLAEPRPNRPRLVPDPEAGPLERAAFAAWMGQPWPFAVTETA